MSDFYSTPQQAPAYLQSALSLAETAEAANFKHEKIDTLASKCLENALEIGALLINVRNQVGSRKFAPWIKENLKFSRNTAYQYIRLAENREEVIRNARVTDSVRSALEVLAGPEPKEEATTPKSEPKHTNPEPVSETSNLPILDQLSVVVDKMCDIAMNIENVPLRNQALLARKLMRQARNH